jgi:hypothetical protein
VSPRHATCDAIFLFGNAVTGSVNSQCLDDVAYRNMSFSLVFTL